MSHMRHKSGAASPVAECNFEPIFPKMNPAPGCSLRDHRSASAFTFLELLAILIVLLVLAGLLLPGHGGKERAKAAVCINNLKQIALANMMWATDHARGFPADVTVEEGGYREAVLAGSAMAAFAAITNDGIVKTPRIFICPVDTQRQDAYFNNNEVFQAGMVSYFINADARTNGFSQILAGDRNLALRGKPATGVVVFSTAANASWNPIFHRNLKGSAGPMAFVDGHVEVLRDQYLARKLQDCGATTNRFVFP